MKLVDKIILNRTLAIVFNFIMSLLKFFTPKSDKDLDDNPIIPVPKPPLRKRLPRPWKKSDE